MFLEIKCLSALLAETETKTRYLDFIIFEKKVHICRKLLLTLFYLQNVQNNEREKSNNPSGVPRGSDQIAAAANTQVRTSFLGQI